LIRIVFLSANPADTPQLKVTEEYNQIYDRLRSVRFRAQFKLVPRNAVSVRDLQRVLLDEEPQVVHFSGHGSQQLGLIFQNDAGLSEEVPPHALINLFKIEVIRKNIRCVVLNACYTERQAKAIAKHVDSVVGMNRAVSDAAATNFAIYFYQALGFGSSIKDAFELGCVQLELLNIPEQHIPKLMVRDGMDPSRIILVTRKGSKQKVKLDISTTINRMKDKYDRLTDGTISLEEYWSATLPLLRKLSSDQEIRPIIGNPNADSLNLLTINLATTMSDYRSSIELGDEQKASLSNRRMMVVSKQVINKLESITL
jgi:hypothetical protein